MAPEIGPLLADAFLFNLFLVTFTWVVHFKKPSAPAFGTLFPGFLFYRSRMKGRMLWIFSGAPGQARFNKIYLIKSHFILFIFLLFPFHACICGRPGTSCAWMPGCMAPMRSCACILRAHHAFAPCSRLSRPCICVNWRLNFKFI